MEQKGHNTQENSQNFAHHSLVSDIVSSVVMHKAREEAKILEQCRPGTVTTNTLSLLETIRDYDLNDLNTAVSSRCVDIVSYLLAKKNSMDPRQQKEASLESFLATGSNLELIEPGLRFICRQQNVASGRLDILAVDMSGCSVILELKCDRYRSVEVAIQLRKYLQEKNNHRCIFVAPYIAPSLYFAVKDFVDEGRLSLYTVNEVEEGVDYTFETHDMISSPEANTTETRHPESRAKKSSARSGKVKVTGLKIDDAGDHLLQQEPQSLLSEDTFTRFLLSVEQEHFVKQFQITTDGTLFLAENSYAELQRQYHTFAIERLEGLSSLEADLLGTRKAIAAEFDESFDNHLSYGTSESGVQLGYRLTRKDLIPLLKKEDLQVVSTQSALTVTLPGDPSLQDERWKNLRLFQDSDVAAEWSVGNCTYQITRKTLENLLRSRITLQIKEYSSTGYPIISDSGASRDTYWSSQRACLTSLCKFLDEADSYIRKCISRKSQADESEPIEVSFKPLWKLIVEALSTGIKTDPENDSESHEEIAKTRILISDFIFEPALVQDTIPTQALVFSNMMAAARIAGEHTVAVNIAEKYLSRVKHPHPRVLAHLGLAQSKLGLEQEARKTINQAIDSHIADRIALEIIVNGKLANNDYASAINVCTRAIQALPFVGHFYHVLSTAYRNAGELDKALEVAKKYREHFPFSIRPRAQLARLYSEIGDLERTRSSLDALYRMSPHDKFTLHSLAKLKLAEGKYRQALKYFQELARINPREGSSWLFLAAYALKHEDYKRTRYFLDELYQENNSCRDSILGLRLSLELAVRGVREEAFLRHLESAKMSGKLSKANLEQVEKRYRDKKRENVSKLFKGARLQISGKYYQLCHKSNKQKKSKNAST